MTTIKVVAAVICDNIKEKNKILASARGYGCLLYTAINTNSKRVDIGGRVELPAGICAHLTDELY